MLQKLTGLAVAGLCLVMAGAQAQPISTGAAPTYATIGKVVKAAGIRPE